MKKDSNLVKNIRELKDLNLVKLRNVLCKNHAKEKCNV